MKRDCEGLIVIERRCNEEIPTITAALTHLQEQNYGTAAQTLMRAQQNAEEFYISAGCRDE